MVTWEVALFQKCLLGNTQHIRYNYPISTSFLLAFFSTWTIIFSLTNYLVIAIKMFKTDFVKLNLCYLNIFMFSLNSHPYLLKVVRLCQKIHTCFWDRVFLHICNFWQIIKISFKYRKSYRWGDIFPNQFQYFM